MRTWGNYSLQSYFTLTHQYCIIYTKEYYSAIKNNEFMKFLGKWMDLGDIILSEVTQSQKNTHEQILAQKLRIPKIQFAKHMKLKKTKDQSVDILFLILRRNEVSTLWSSFLSFMCFANCILGILSSWANIHLSGSAYHPCVFFCDWVTSLRMITSRSIHLPKNFINSLLLIAE